MVDYEISGFAEYLLSYPQTSYLRTHYKRYLETYRTLHPHIRPCKDVLELGDLSVIASFLQERCQARVLAVQTDLRFPYGLPDSSADLVLSLEVLEHLNDAIGSSSSVNSVSTFAQSGAKRMFTECMRVLRPGGLLLLTTPNASSLDTLANVLMKRHPFLYPPHVREYTLLNVSAMAQEAGFMVERQATYFAWNPQPGIKRDVLLDTIQRLGFDTSDRGDDMIFLLRKPHQ